MRRLAIARLVIAALAACGGAPAGPGASPERAAPAGLVSRRADRDPPPVDPLAALAPAQGDDELVSWLVPGRVQLELGGTVIEGAGDTRPLEVAAIERQGELLRAAVRLEHARFSVWTDRARLLALLRADHRVSAGAAHEPVHDVGAVLRAGARVRRLARRGAWTQVRYVGALQVEGWVPEEKLVDAGPRRDPVGRYPSGRRTLLVIPGTVVRAEMKWASRAVATMADGHFLDTVREVDQAWTEVAYADGDVEARGFVSRRDPPGRVHRSKGPAVPPPTVAPNGKVASGTCLYARVRGEAIGYIVGDRDAQLDDLGAGWWALAIDTPWGPIAFAARGPAPGELVPCAPAGSVPPPAGRQPAQPPVP